ncbi:MAG TPA: RidA family protein [Chitinophagaceae bacterium]|nr:RidA family protein [Chitinophagaceae bacterium]
MPNKSIEEKLQELGYALPVLPTSKGIYKRCLVDGSHLYVSGHISVNSDGSSITGKLGKDLDEEQGKAAARQCGLAILSSVKDHFGNLDKVKRVIKLLGMVNATTDYEKHPVVINGCSELFVALWGEDNGKGVRSAVGMGSLPGNVAVEIEAIFELKPPAPILR